MNLQSNESDEPSCEVTDLSPTTVRSTIESLILSIAKSILDGDRYSFAVLSRSSSNHLLIPELDRPLRLSSFVISCPNAGVAGISTLLSSMCYTEFSISIPAAGGAFSYLRVTFGEYLSSPEAKYLSSVSGDPNSWRVEVPGFIKGYNMLDFPAVALIFILTLCLCYSTKESSLLNLIMTVFHVALLCFIIVVGFCRGSSKNLVSSGGIAPFGAKGVFDGAAIVYFNYIGYDSVSTLAEEIRKPSRNLQALSNMGFFFIRDRFSISQNGILEFAKVLRVQEQVVAGKLYHMTLVAVDGGMKKIYEAKIWVKPWMNFKQLQEFKSASNVSPFSTADLGLMRTL